MLVVPAINIEGNMPAAMDFSRNESSFPYRNVSVTVTVSPRRTRRSVALRWFFSSRMPI